MNADKEGAKGLFMLCGLCVLCASVLAIATGWAGAGVSTEPATRPASRAAGACEPYLYIPPALADSVVFYHSFSRPDGKPEVNLLEADLIGPGASASAPGLTGPGFRPAAKGPAITLRKCSWPLTRPITVSLWFRLEEPMKEDSPFHLVSLWADGGYISHFVRGKGTWCALKEPTFVIQLYNFRNISNVNGIDFGSAWLPHGQWHHAALTVSEGSRIRVFWDARLRSEITAKGRLFRPDDAVRTIGLGPQAAGHPMTVDELLILDRALTAEEVAAYVTAVRKLAEAGFPFRGQG